ncbi:hypothetical protein EXS65_00230 [Candidatus Peribacteria bacterium]|nr:hypothetical protein [Candidatus Peribacteria bacterium]
MLRHCCPPPIESLRDSTMANNCPGGNEEPIMQLLKFLDMIQSPWGIIPIALALLVICVVADFLQSLKD